MLRLSLTTLLLIALAIPARSAVGPEKTVSRAAVFISGLVSMPTGFLLAWTEQINSAAGGELFVQTIDTRGEMIGNPLRFPGVNFMAGLGSDGTSALLVWGEGKLLRGAWVGDRSASEPFLIADVAAAVTAISVAGQEGRYAIAWAEAGKAVHLATISARGTAIERRVEIARDDALDLQIAAGTDKILVHWNERPSNCCPYPYSPARVTYASWELAVAPAAELYPSQYPRSALSLPGGNFAIAKPPRLLFLSPQSPEGQSFTRAWANPVALTLWLGNLTVLWERLITAGSPRGTYLSVQRDFTPAGEPPPAFTISRGLSVVGARLASSESLVLVAYEEPNIPSGTGARLVYRAVTPDDLSTLPARPAPPSIQSQTAGRETVDVVVNTSGDWIEIEPLDDPHAKRMQRQPLQTLTGDTFYSVRAFAENDQGFVTSSAVTFRTIAAFTPRAPLWLRTTDNLNGTWTVEWADLSSNETAFRILLLNEPANDTVLAQVPPNSTRATIPAPSAGRIAIAVMNGSQASLAGTGAVTPLTRSSRRRSIRP